MWHVFNALVGNADAHAKNISLLFEPDRSIRLAPFYDLVCTRTYDKLDRHLAMSVAGVADPGQIRAGDWTRLAEEIGVGKKFLLQLVREMGQSIGKFMPLVVSEFQDLYGDNAAIGMVKPVIEKQTRRIVSQLSF